MRGSSSVVSLAAVAALLHPCAARGQTANPKSDLSSVRTLLNQYCVTCHNTKLKTAGLTLEGLDPAGAEPAVDVWEKVTRKLRSGAMPPAGRPRPEASVAAAAATSLETWLDQMALAAPNPGRTGVHRLNRAEYGNAIRDLLSLQIDARAFLPADDSSYGFDNIADVLTLSPGLLDRYRSAARRISALAVGDIGIKPTLETYKLSPLLVQFDRMGEDLPFGSRGGAVIRHQFPVDGEYVLRLRLQRAAFGGPVRGLADVNEIDIRIDGVSIKRFVVGGASRAHGEDPELSGPLGDELSVRVAVKAGLRPIGVAFAERTHSAPELLGAAHMPAKTISFAAEQGGAMAIGSIEVDGPYHATSTGSTPSRKAIFVCAPQRQDDEEKCARVILTRLARRAFRRPVAADDVRSLIDFYRSGRAEGGFEAGIRWALEKTLVSLEFLFRIERDPAGATPGAAYRVSDVDLASRLSFFLWSSIPDDELLDVAAAGRLKEPIVLERQVRRMLADQRSLSLPDNFGGQWLYLRNLRSVAPDPDAFPGFDDGLREAFQRETELFLASQWQEDHSVLDLLSADYTFLNERLARHYQIPNVYGSHFRRVTLDAANPRRGLLGQASILTVTSQATRTSPVLRGKWILENLLGEPPPPPPPNVEGLSEADAAGQPVSVRERMERHRRNPVCASCHARMDPLGFALENYDAVGRWRRVAEGDAPVDVSAALPDGTTVEGAAGLRELLLARREQFSRTLAEKLLAYALGRGLEPYDMPAIRQITRNAAASGYRWSSLVLGIVRSTPFQGRRSES